MPLLQLPKSWVNSTMDQIQDSIGSQTFKTPRFECPKNSFLIFKHILTHTSFLLFFYGSNKYYN